MAVVYMLIEFGNVSDLMDADFAIVLMCSVYSGQLYVQPESHGCHRKYALQDV